MFFINQEEEETIIEIVDGAKIEKVQEEVASLRAKYPLRRIVVLAEKPAWQDARAAFEAGASDYLPKAKTVGPEREPEEERPIAIRQCGVGAA